MFRKTIRGKVGIQVTIELPDDVSDAERLRIIRMVQSFADFFETQEEFNEAMTEAMIKNGGFREVEN